MQRRQGVVLQIPSCFKPFTCTYWCRRKMAQVCSAAWSRGWYSLLLEQSFLWLLFRVLPMIACRWLVPCFTARWCTRLCSSGSARSLVSLIPQLGKFPAESPSGNLFESVPVWLLILHFFQNRPIIIEYIISPNNVIMSRNIVKWNNVEK